MAELNDSRKPLLDFDQTNGLADIHEDDETRPEDEMPTPRGVITGLINPSAVRESGTHESHRN